MPDDRLPTLSPPAQSQPMGQYYLLDKIARGGMAEIYKGIAYDMHGIQRTVVIKKILPQAAANREFIDMLIAEAKIAVMLSHGNIAQIYDLGKAGDDYFIVMEYVEGRSISQIQRECAERNERIPLAIACYIAAEVAGGLDYMHQRIDERGQPLHIVHRDVSPQNVLISYSGTVKIIDFGIAKARTKLETTEVGILKGKFAYMSPEHARGEVIDHRSDIFSLGVILHEMLTGKRLFKAKETKETLRNVRRAEVAAPSTVRADISPALDAIVLEMLTRDRTARFNRAATIHDRLQMLLHREFPEFREGALADFLTRLFGDQQRGGDAAEEAKTPLLIIDHTQSAIGKSQDGVAREVADSIPAVMAEFMLPDPQEESEALRAKPADESDEPSITAAHEMTLWEVLRELIPLWLGKIGVQRGCYIVGGLLMIPALVIQLRGPWNPQTLWQRINPTYVLRQIPQEKRVPIPFATLTLTSIPAGATVYLNDRKTTQLTPVTVQNLPPDQPLSVGLFLEDHIFWVKELTLAPGATAEFAVPLKMDYGTLEVITRPPGATVRFNGRTAGTTPQKQARMAPGEIVTIEMSKKGFETVTRTVRIRAGQDLVVREPLERIRKGRRRP